ncbi:hypothetical protein RKD42_003710 [Streptomyces ambofaciens]
MSLHGLLDAVVKDTALAEAISAAADGNRMHVDLVGPPAGPALRDRRPGPRDGPPGAGGDGDGP